MYSQNIMSWCWSSNLWIFWICAFSGKFEQGVLSWKRGSDRAFIKSDFFSNFSQQWYQYCLFRRRESLRLRRTKRDLVKKQEYMIEQLEQYRYRIEQLEQYRYRIEQLEQERYSIEQLEQYRYRIEQKSIGTG